MSTNQGRSGLDAIIQKQVQSLGNNLRREFEKETNALFNQLQARLQKELEAQIVDLFSSLSQTNALTAQSGGNANSALARLASQSIRSIFNRQRTSTTRSTAESVRSINEQEKFRTSRSQQLHDASAQLSGGEKNS